MSDRKEDYIIFIEDDQEPTYVENANGLPLHFKTMKEALKQAEDEARDNPGKEISVYGIVAISIAPVGGVETKEFKS